MAEFNFLQNPITKKWIVLAPRRAKRPDVAKGAEPICPFCLGREKDEKEIYRVRGEVGDANWLIRVVPNKFPFAPIHEIIIHSPDHHKNFDELPLYQVELIIKTYRQRFLTHQKKGQVIIFHNRGEGGGESLPPHTQLAVIPSTIKMDIARLSPMASLDSGPTPISLSSDFTGINTSDSKTIEHESTFQTPHFYLFCPKTSQWPDEVWIAPKKRGRAFSEITDGEVADLSYTLSRLIQIFDLRHGHEFPYNFYIYPGGDWYLRLIPRVKVLGGFELTTGVFVNTQDPDKTIGFIKEHFGTPDWEKIRKEHRAEYERRV
jgi:UDPglucose--hexose-1-phosphate uridylyltransferase